MSILRILYVEDEECEGLIRRLKSLTPAELAETGFEKCSVTHVTNQTDADAAAGGLAAAEFHLILLDLSYPKRRGDETNNTAPFEGMMWLPKLRRLQPKAAIVILTKHTHERALMNVVEAIRDYHANDFVPKTAPFRDLVSRIGIAIQNARQRQKLLLLEKEWRQLTRNGAARIYEQDVSDLLTKLRHLIDRIAQRIESGDPSAIAAAPDAIRGESRSVARELESLTTMMEKRLNPGKSRRLPVDLSELARDLFLQYDSWLEEVNAKPTLHVPRGKTEVMTFVADLKVALHEVITNAIEALNLSKRPRCERTVDISVVKERKSIVVTVEDNGDGFSDEAVANMFQVGKTTRDASEHVGLGLYVARRAMYALGGDVKAENRPNGGARVRLFIPV